MKNQSKLSQSLIEIGLNENEAKIYLASLSLGTATVLQLAQVSEVKRTTVYEVVEALLQKGLMKKEIQGFKTLYAPEHPERLENALDSRRMILHKIYPELEGLYNLKGGESTIKYYEGLRSIKNLYDALLDDLKPQDFYYAISNIAEWQGLDEDFFLQRHVEIRSRMHVQTKLLFLDSETARARKNLAPKYNEEIQLLPADSNVHVDLVITPYKLIMFQLHNPLEAILIENQAMIQIQKSMFEMIWAGKTTL